jgi:hypothetical protein
MGRTSFSGMYLCAKVAMAGVAVCLVCTLAGGRSPCTGPTRPEAAAGSRVMAVSIGSRPVTSARLVAFRVQDVAHHSPIRLAQSALAVSWSKI